MKKIWQGSIVATILLLTNVCGLACGDCDVENNLVESGEYAIVDGGLGVFVWLDGAQMDIDRAADTSTLRYTRNGTTYEVEFTLK